LCIYAQGILKKEAMKQFIMSIFLGFSLVSWSQIPLGEKKAYFEIQDDSSIVIKSEIRPQRIQWKIDDSIVKTVHIKSMNEFDSVNYLLRYNYLNPVCFCDFSYLYRYNMDSIKTLNYLMKNNPFLINLRGKVLNLKVSDTLINIIYNPRTFKNAWYHLNQKSKLWLTDIQNFYSHGVLSKIVNSDSLTLMKISKQFFKDTNVSGNVHDLINYNFVTSNISPLEYVVDNSNEYLLFGNRYYGKFYKYNLKKQTLVDSIQYPFVSGYRYTDFVSIGASKEDIFNHQSNFQMNLINSDSILMSDHKHLVLIDFKNKTHKRLKTFDDTLIHFVLYRDEIKFLSNFIRFQDEQDNWTWKTKFTYHKFNWKKDKHIKKDILLSGNIDSSSFWIDGLDNIYTLKYDFSFQMINISSVQPNYMNIDYYKKYGKVLKIDTLGNILDEYPKTKESLTFHFRSWDIQHNFQLDKNGNLILDGAFSNTRFLYKDNRRDTIFYLDEGFHKIHRTIDTTLVTDLSKPLFATLYYIDGDSLTLCYTKSCKSLATKEFEDRNINFSIYPNPVKDKLTISLIDFTKRFSISVYDLHGRKIETKDFENKKNVTLETNKWSKGIYILEVEAEEKKTRIKFQKE
jgi:hypothetical protein